MPLVNYRPDSPSELSSLPSFTVNADDGGRPEYAVAAATGDVVLQNIMPEAEYMYGCTPTAMAMLLGYYDLYGIGGYDYSNIIEGTISVNSRGSDGNIYNMNEFNSILGSFIATEDYVTRFYSINGQETTPAQELPYTFVDGGSPTGISELDTSRWNCLADYLGTGQYWRGLENLASYIYYADLQTIIDYESTMTITGAGTQRTFDWHYSSTLYGLNLYVESRGYSLDKTATGNFKVDGYGGTYTFEDYTREIDAGRPVLLQITGHTMVGYGYNAATREIILDDTYHSNQRMSWDGTYYYSGEYRDLLAITIINLQGGTRTDFTAPVLSGLPQAAVEDFTVAITWEAATDNVAVAGYILKIGEEQYTVKDTSFTITLANGTYTYSLLAYDAADNRSEWSQEQSFTVNFSDTEAPVFGALPNAVIYERRVTITWEAATDNIAVAGYEVRIGNQEYHTRLTSCSVVLDPGDYSYSIRAYDEAGNYSDWTMVQNFTILDPAVDITPPALNGLPWAQVKDDVVTITWSEATDDFGVVGYLLKVGNQEYAVEGTSYTLSLYPGEYIYQLKACDAAGNQSNWSQEMVFRIADDTPPEFVGQPRVTVNNDTITITWNEATDNAGIKEYLVTLNGREYNVGNQTSFSLANQSPGEYTYQVTAVDYAGNSAESPIGKFSVTDFSSDQVAEFLTGRISHLDTAFVWQLDLQPGLYAVAGDFSGLNAAVTIVDSATGKLVGKAKIKNGTLNFKKSLLLSGQYTIYLSSADGGKSRGDFAFKMSGSLFTRGDNRDDAIGSLRPEHRITIDRTAGMLVADEWVGFGDAVDYRELTLQNDGKYVFDLTAGDAAKLTVYSLQPNGKLKTVTAASMKSGSVSTKAKLLTAGTYYLAVQSANAKKGGSAAYSVKLNSRSIFFTAGDNRDDAFASLRPEHKISVDRSAGVLMADEWVGFGDAVDYRQLTLQNNGNYVFDLSASDAAKLTIYALQSNGKLKAVSTASVKSGTASGKSKLLAAGTYYLAVQSTNAAKGGNAAYSVSLNAQTAFFTAGDNSDDSIGSLTAAHRFVIDSSPRQLAADNWVGFGDRIDYRELQFVREGNYSFTLSGVSDTLKLTLFEEANGKLKKLAAATVKNGEGTLAAAELSDTGRYFLAVEAVNAGKGGGSGYSLDVFVNPQSAKPVSAITSAMSDLNAALAADFPVLPVWTAAELFQSQDDRYQNFDLLA